MKIAKYLQPTFRHPSDEPANRGAPVPLGSIGRVEGDTLLPLDLSAAGLHSLTELLDTDDPVATAQSLPTGEPLPLDALTLLPPIDRQEVWAAGVTYRRSQTARMEESEAAASCYDRVYTAARPELFFKATPNRVRGHGQPLRIRADAIWNVPEPEITLVLDRKLRIVGLTVGNDMSSRDIEGDNPLYLPQAKCYDGCAGLGPWILLARPLPPLTEIGVQLRIERDGEVVFSGESGADQMARGFEDLVGWLGRDNVFPDGAFLMTGTGIVPDSSFTLKPADIVHISVDGVGTLSNEIIQGTVQK
ncbi:MAG: fumarylacetoacetate hydrolase family protein [Pirellulaceae bacterium]